ncbi:MAG: hypothetical protein JJE44_02425 [Flavobacteriaceae bacterium]|nr:hypothetical protein [Flavobacteriaceae bacterium]
MKFLVIVQDLRVSGTSEGLVSRSFIAKLRKVYQDSIIDVVHLKHHPSEDFLHMLPVDSVQTQILDLKTPIFTRWLNKIYWRLFHLSLNERYIQKAYGVYIAKIDYQKYDHIFIRSAGLGFESILGAKDLPILKKSIINFHDPYPVFWCAGSQNRLSNLELFRLKEMYKVVFQAKGCISPAKTLSNDMELLYGARKKFYALPHQYDETVFDLSDVDKAFTKNKKITICYHGAIQFGRNIYDLLDAYQELVGNSLLYKENTEFILRVKKTIDIDYLSKKYFKTENIIVLGPTNFSNSAYEQIHNADINMILENGPVYSNILVGKAPFLASFNKPILSISPIRSELRDIIKEEKYIAACNNQEEIKQKLEHLIMDRLYSNKPVYPFGDYFSDENFKIMLENVLFEK